MVYNTEVERSAKKCVYPIVGGVALLLLAASAVAPSISVATVPAAAVLLYYLSVTVGLWVLPAGAALLAAAGAALHGAHVFPITGAAVLALLTVPRALRKKLPLVWELALCATAALAAVCVTLGVFALATGVSPTAAVADAYAKLADDPVLARLAARYYKTRTAEHLGHAPLIAADELYAAETLAVYASRVARELEGDFLWYLTGFGVFAGGLAGAGGLAAASADGTLALAPRMREFRLGKTYLSGGALPALAFGLTAFYAPMRPVATAVINAMVTLPTALCGITLLYHTLGRFTGKAARVTAMAVFWLSMAAAAVFYEWGMLVLGFLGLADCVLNVRKLLDWALG